MCMLCVFVFVYLCVLLVDLETVIIPVACGRYTLSFDETWFLAVVERVSTTFSQKSILPYVVLSIQYPRASPV